MLRKDIRRYLMVFDLLKKSIFGVASKNILKVFLPEMQLKALSCWDLVRKGAKELNAHSHSWQERG